MEFSHYPALSIPFEGELPVSDEQPCPYLPARFSRNRAFAADYIPALAYHQLMDAGFRRSGEYFYQPVCRGCRACIPIRVPVHEFQPSRSQRRIAQRNHDVTLDVAMAEYRDEDFALYRKYSTQWHGKDVSDDDYAEFLVYSPVETIAFRYRAPDGRLLAVGICDVCELSLSSVYFFFDPDHAARSLGTLGALREIAWAAAHKIPHYYLGFWIEGSPTMEYKSRFRPYELLGSDGIWKRASIGS